MSEAQSKHTPGLVFISEAETAALMREAGRDSPLSLVFGVRGVAIREALAPWAAKRVSEMRAAIAKATP